MRTSRNELKESCPTNEKQKMTNEINYVDNKIRDDFVSFETVYSNSNNTKDDFNKQQKHKEDLKFNEITTKVTEMQNWNFNSMHEGNRGKTQKNTQDKYIEFANTGECKREHRWKQHRTRDYDKRRNIDLNTLGLETTESLANQKYPQMNS
ncbi:uncharacterized protein LOC123671127 isoform X1 [Harmonia axyridis]|uniref:uncharacterized protein LOC123671127 isoform X1 n=1 Tax=Harmonia axyridis TaxID=115357 RepID=UPI001E277EFF|nr:uncharacterized protein LOC123671127 isoform X1 [Harmonia axyridis]